MTTTHQDNGHEDQEDGMRQDDITSHLSHPGTENPENPNEFHKNRQIIAELFDKNCGVSVFSIRSVFGMLSLPAQHPNNTLKVSELQRLARFPTT